jgi:phosphoenolpyruvate synthase/pyruvate phosphate dikinase
MAFKIDPPIPTDLAKRLIDEGIQSISFNPDPVIDTWLYIAGVET